MQPPTFSVVIPVHNGAAYVEDAMTSVAAQTYKAWECLVFDDGSSDDSVDVIRAWLNDSGDERWRLLRHDGNRNIGEPLTRNAALKHARYPWVAFLDQDDCWLPHKLERQVDFIAHHSQVDAVTCWPDLQQETDQVPGYVRVWMDSFGKVEARTPGLVELDSLLLGCPIVLSGVVARRDALRSIGGFRADLPYTHDWLMWACLASRRPLAVLPESLVRYRLHGSNSMRLATSEPLALLKLLLEIHDYLVEWLAEDSGITVEEARAYVAEHTKWERAAQDAEIHAADLWASLSTSSEVR